MTLRRLRGLATSALLLLVSCGDLPASQIPSRPVTSRATSAAPRFDNPAATRILVATFPSPTGADPADGLLELVESELHRYEPITPAPDAPSPRQLEIKRLSILVASHQEAHALLSRIGADILVWGSATCDRDRESGAMRSSQAALCPHVTIDPAPRDSGTAADKRLNLDWLTDFDLPPLAPPSRLGLARYLVGVHFQGDARVVLAVSAFSEADTQMALEGRDRAWIDAYLAQAQLHLTDLTLAGKSAGAALSRLSGKGGVLESDLNVTLGDARLRDGDPAGALACYRRALLVAEKALVEGHPHLATIEGRLGAALAALGDTTGALVHDRRALALDEAYLGADSPPLAHDWEQVGTLMAKRVEADAVAALERARAIYGATRGPESVEVTRIEERLGDAFFHAGDHAQAVTQYRRALVLLEKQPKLDEALLIIFLNRLAEALSKRGDHEGALVAFRRARAVLEKVDGTDSARVADNDRRLAEELLKGGDYPEAVEQLQAALRVYSTVYGATSERVASCETEIGKVMLFHPDLVRAAEHYLRALAIYQSVVPASPRDISIARAFLAIAIAAQSGRAPGEESAGVVVTDCSSPSCIGSGLKAGDWLISIGPIKIKDQQYLTELLKGWAPARKATFTLLRAGKQLRLQPFDPKGLAVIWIDWVMPRP